MQELTSVNLRVAREKTIPLPQELCAAMQTHFIGMLLVGEPGSGKTTLLRSMARELVCQKKLVSVIDERRELFSGNSRRKSPGEALDVISGIPKGQAVQMALRTLSPQILLLDELGGLDEVTALEQGLFSGVDFIATLHAASPEEAVGRPQVQALQARGALHVLVWLKGRAEPGQVREVRFYEQSLLHGIGAVCLVFCGWCVGDGVCIRAEAHRQALQKTIALLERIRREIEFRRTDLRALLCAMQREGLVGQAEHSLQTLAPDPALTRREQISFRACMAGLGHAEAAQECQQLAFYIQQFEAFQTELAPQLRQTNELSHKLGLALGLAAAILLI